MRFGFRSSFLNEPKSHGQLSWRRCFKVKAQAPSVGRSPQISIWTRPLLALCCAVTTSCSLNLNKNPNVILIAVEGLGANQIDCLNENSEALRSGLLTLCQKSVRFSHAFTPSIQSPSSLASILTGKYSFQIRKKTNVSDFFPSAELSIAEELNSKGIPTAFFSGGAPILRKANLHQGFEVFDDFFKPSLTRTFRPFAHLIPQFKNWRKDRGNKYGLTIFYVSDLLYKDFQTYDNLGKARNLSFESQLEELDETLGHFFNFLKEENIFDSSYIILTGLNGPFQASRENELSETNVFSERAQVSLLIKPPQKPSDQALSSAVNQNVSLVDLGNTLRSIFDLPVNPEADLSLDLSARLKNYETKLPEDRVVLTESHWHQYPESRWALRKESLLFIFDETLKIYNTFIDRSESAPIPLQEPSLAANLIWAQQFSEKNHFSPWAEPPVETFIKWKSLSNAFQDNVATEEMNLALQKAAHRLLNDSLFQTLYSIQLLRNQDWLALQKWANGLSFKDLEKIAYLQMGKTVGASYQSPCLQALDSLDKFREISRKCDEKLSYHFLEWLQYEMSETATTTQKEQAKLKFMRLYFIADLDERLSRLNWKYQAPFDFGLSINPEILTLEMMFTFPSAKKYRQMIEKDLQSMHESNG